jgi:WD40 repeat protein
VQILPGHIGAVAGLSFCSDGVHLASAGGTKADHLALWDTRSGRRINRKGDGKSLGSITFAARGPALLARYYRKAYFWADPVHQSAPPRTWECELAVLRGDGGEVAYRKWIEDARSTLHFLDPLEWATSRAPVALQLHIAGSWSCLVWSPDTHLLATMHYTADGHRIDLHRAETGRSVGAPMFLRQDGYPRLLTFSPDGQTLAAFANSPTFARWDTTTYQPLPELKGHDAPLVGLGYLPDGRLLSCDQAGVVCLWDSDTGRCLETHDWRIGRLKLLAVAPDGMRAAVGTETGSILLWDID